MNYIVQWRYESSLGGPWMQGDRVGLDDELAKAVNRDSPGVLMPEAEVPAVAFAAEAEPETEAMEKPPQDRQKKSGRNRGIQESITKNDFQAVKGDK